MQTSAKGTPAFHVANHDVDWLEVIIYFFMSSCYMPLHVGKESYKQPFVKRREKKTVKHRHNECTFAVVVGLSSRRDTHADSPTSHANPAKSRLLKAHI